MGLKNRLSKMKSFLFDEEEEKEEKVPVKKGFKKEKEMFKPKKEELEEIEELYINDISEEPETEGLKSRTTKVEKEFSFPDFDDDDFMVSDKKPEPIIKPEKEEVKPIPLYQGSKRKEEFKRFKPSPIISPIYGLLDEEGNTVKEDRSDFSYNDDISLDDVRKKAYGSAQEDLEDTLKKLSTKTIEEAEEEMEKEQLSRSKNKVIKEKITSIAKDDVEIEDDDDDDMILPNVNFKEIDVDKESKSIKKEKVKKEESSKKKKQEDDDDDDDETKEQDLFNLIDTMYQENGDED